MRSRSLVPLLVLSLASVAALELALVGETERADTVARRDAASESSHSPRAVELAPIEHATLPQRERVVAPLASDAGSAAREDPLAVDEGVVVASGRVVDERGAPLAGADVRVRAEIEPGTLAPSRAADTDEHGAFRIEAAPAARYELVVAHEGFVPLHATLDGMRAGDATSGLVLRMDPGLAIEGVVSFAGGPPADGARIRVASADVPRAERVVRARCDAGGHFVVRGLTPGRYVVDAETSAVPALRESERLRDARFRRFRARAASVVAGTRELELVLRHDLVLAGRVLDDRGRPVTAFGVRAVPVGGFALELAGEATQREGFDDVEGRFELDGLAPGDWRVRVRAAKPKHAWQGEFLLHVEDDVQDALFHLALVPSANE